MPLVYGGWACTTPGGAPVALHGVVEPGLWTRSREGGHTPANANRSFLFPSLFYLSPLPLYLLLESSPLSSKRRSRPAGEIFASSRASGLRGAVPTLICSSCIFVRFSPSISLRGRVSYRVLDNGLNWPFTIPRRGCSRAPAAGLGSFLIPSLACPFSAAAVKSIWRGCSE
jgi:hypothetical protein